jgi:hypothetical protein
MPSTDVMSVSGLRAHASSPTGGWAVWSYRVILTSMKTAISVPDETFEKASRRAHDLGMSRSEFFSRAAARYLDELDAESLTHQIDLAVASLGDGDDSTSDAVAVGHRALVDESGEW